MKTEQEQRRAIRQILFDANDICQATPCENEYCIYHGDYRCYDNVIIDKLIRAGYGDVSEYKAEIKRLRTTLGQCSTELNSALESLKSQCREIGELKAKIKQAQIDVLNELRERITKDRVANDTVVINANYEIKELIKEIENDEK